MKKIVIILSVLIGLGTVSDGYTAVRMPGVFGDNMVLQRDTLVSLWGWAEGKRVSVRVSWSKERYMAVPDGEGSIAPARLRPITFDPLHSTYRRLGEVVGRAFPDGDPLE